MILISLHSRSENDRRKQTTTVDEIPAQIFADRPPAEWRATAEAARRVAEVMDDTTGQRAFLDFADACEQLRDILGSPNRRG